MHSSYFVSRSVKCQIVIYTQGSLILKIATVLFFPPQATFDKYLIQPNYFCLNYYLFFKISFVCNKTYQLIDI